VRIKHPGSAQHFGRYIEGSKEFIGSDPEKSSQPITEEARALILSQVSSHSDHGIIRAHCQSPGGARTPRGSHLGSIPSFNESIFSLSDTRRSLEARAHCLGQFSVRSDESSHQGEYIFICSSCRELLGLYAIDLSVHVQILSHLLITGILC
jgi:hypothetical protein